MNELDKLLRLIRHLIIGFVWSILIFAVLTLLVSIFMFSVLCSS